MSSSALNANSCTVAYNTISCFEKLTDEEMKLLEENTREVTYKKGDIICKQGTFASHVMFVCGGLVKTYIENETQTLLLRIVPAGSIIGLSSLLEDHNTFSFSASTYTDSRIRMFDLNILRNIVKKMLCFLMS